MPENPAGALAFCSHDHAVCTKAALAHADHLAVDKALRLTPVRRRTLEILLEAHQALGAYDVLERLAEDGFGNQPPVAYRALEFLVEHGFAHRIRRLNAFTACMHPDHAHKPVFFICKSCAVVAETAGTDVQIAVEKAAQSFGFQVDRMNLEAVGLCPTCQEQAE
ncbi:Fur family transcriptional regulator [Pseudohalocynthiibacter aestuariivivens]|jgi:Fur family transcriptional regulator, zinc uptake regulator|uniref:Fur family transcriptional regulator n=1 Tax=Pseudohalocynthiibacter aestuariivivens TaxID=1591409 RepID=A0ABV5JI05_9RHOB|nr:MULTISPECIES: Fur family transcriptional regulator [Pseudohalocynthiibacter]MBS9717388.1 transcriptional repressor [Pseudohalocynthiibacter aestuariivivens]MCK0102278.1 transcriptional repressor [Pseudohalocynthiibacter sp. F2068]